MWIQYFKYVYNSNQTARRWGTMGDTDVSLRRGRMGTPTGQNKKTTPRSKRRYHSDEV